MGIFSKKKVKCERCGKEFEVRFSFLGFVCDECEKEEKANKDRVWGYINYADKVLSKSYEESEYDKIVAHRVGILEKYKHTNTVTKDELQYFAKNYDTMPGDDLMDILSKMSSSSLESTHGCAYSDHIFVSTQFEKVVVDVEDIFAVGYTSDSKHTSADGEVILCAIFTNDPYIPVLPMIQVGKTKFLEMKSKEGRQALAEWFEEICPNLTYPVQDLKSLQKQIKKENAVRGNIDKKVMLDMISDASCSRGLFDTDKMHPYVFEETLGLLNTFGYLTSKQMQEYSGMNDRAINFKVESRVKEILGE